MSESSFKERFCRAIKLNEANDDSEKNPFQSKYDARKILKEIREDLRKMREENESDITLRAMEASIDCLIGVNFINTEETSTGQEALNRVIQLCETYEKHPMFVSTLIVSNNELGVLWSNREEGIQRAYEHLTRAEQFYTEYKRDLDDTPMTGRELLTSEVTDAERITSFEALHTNTLYYLAQAHRTLGNPDLSATYCMKTLHRQLGSKSFVRVDWAVNCACLSQYYITKNMFAEAKHCLACADYVLDETTEEEDSRLVEKRADVSRCWVKYCLCLLEESKAKLANSIGDMDTTRQQNADTSTTEGLKHESRFPLEVTLIEEKCPHDYCVNFNQAKKVFQFGKDRATESLKHFVLDGFVTDHIELNQDMSRLYQHVSFFEPNYDVRCKMYKRRLDMLIKIVGEINPQYYLAVTRQLQFEIGETYSDMMDMKVAILTSSGQPPNQHSVKKINLLCYSSIKYFGLFLDTLRLPGKKFPERFESDVERPALIAHFYIARLYGKLIPADSSEKLANLKLSHQFYTWIVTYTKINDDAALCVKQELDICREMSELLPQSMDRLM